jgi:hypothetical protein
VVRPRPARPAPVDVLPWLWRQIEHRTRPPAPPTAAPGDDVTPEGVFLDAAVRFLDVQVSTNDVLDNKTANAVSVGSTVLPLTFGLLYVGSTTVPRSAILCLSLALTAYVALLGAALRASRISRLEYRPDLSTLEAHSRTHAGDILQRWVATEYLASVEANKKHLAVKAQWAGVATAALYIEVLLASLAAMATLLL